MGIILRDALSLYLVTDRALSLGRSLLAVVGEAVRGGVTMVQLREKECSSREFIALGRAVHDILKPSGISLIINDRADIAMVVGAEGLHIGQGDMTYADARRLLGAQAIIGLSIESEAQARECLSFSGLDYVGVSPVFATPTKTDTASALGLEGVAMVRQLVGVDMPLVAIGGVQMSNIQSVIGAGADGVAVVSGICSAECIASATGALLAEIKLSKR